MYVLYIVLLYSGVHNNPKQLFRLDDKPHVKLRKY